MAAALRLQPRARVPGVLQHPFIHAGFSDMVQGGDERVIADTFRRRSETAHHRRSRSVPDLKILIGEGAGPALYQAETHRHRYEADADDDGYMLEAFTAIDACSFEVEALAVRPGLEV
ncbi:hypothetical protein [Aureimonas frigidaquae]|uniref:hypothetical protein n=1 Tax=Aureimonas frigidaquae TaxID=424757 RepID=UPI0007828FD0|nr:hypothetical protein [Aureimonas frigidaquae]